MWGLQLRFFSLLRFETFNVSIRYLRALMYRFCFEWHRQRIFSASTGPVTWEYHSLSELASSIWRRPRSWESLSASFFTIASCVGCARNREIFSVKRNGYGYDCSSRTWIATYQNFRSTFPRLNRSIVIGAEVQVGLLVGSVLYWLFNDRCAVTVRNDCTQNNARSRIYDHYLKERVLLPPTDSERLHGHSWIIFLNSGEALIMTTSNLTVTKRTVGKNSKTCTQLRY